MPDDRLTERLRAYEARIPDADAPDLFTQRARGTAGWPVLFASGAAAMAAIALVVVVVVNTDLGPSPSPTLPEGSPSAVASPPPTDQPSPGPSATNADSPAASTTVAPSAVTPSEWQLTATFGQGEQQPTFVFDATAWGGGFAAIGLRLPQFASDVGPYGGQPLIWTSPDGIEWTESTLDVQLETQQSGAPVDARIEHMLALPDGRLLAVRAAYGPVEAWVSADAATWDAVDLGLGGLRGTAAVGGSSGYVLLGESPDGDAQVWASSDGLSWQLTHSIEADLEAQLESVAAGPEGYVIVGALRADGDRPLVLASSDGRSWVAAPDQPALAEGSFPVDVAPLGGDWVATGFGAPEGQGRSMIWRSPNGLAWTQDLGPDDPAGRETYYSTDIAGVAGQVILSPAEFCLCGPFQDPTVAWSTTDGITWAVVEPDASYVTDAAEADGTVVAIGRIGRGDQAAFWVLAP